MTVTKDLLETISTGLSVLEQGELHVIIQDGRVVAITTIQRTKVRALTNEFQEPILKSDST